MDYQNRVGNKQGGGGLSSSAETNAARRARVREILSQSNSNFLENDPYVFKNHLGHLECRLCLTTHVSDASYVKHIKGKKHQTNLQKRQHLLEKGPGLQSTLKGISSVKKKHYIKIGTPAYQIRKVRHPITEQLGLSIVVEFPKVAPGVKPLHRFMSYYEQTVDQLPPDKQSKYQYLIVSCEPYENICVKIPNKHVVRGKEESALWDFWDLDIKTYYLQFFFE